MVLTRGAMGAEAWFGKHHVFAPVHKAPVVDTIGAGDSTNAGWLAAWLRGWPLERAARMAAVCGSLSTRARGGTAAQPTWDEAAALL